MADWYTSYSMYCGILPHCTQKTTIFAPFPAYSALLSVPVLIQKSNLYNIQLNVSCNNFSHSVYPFQATLTSKRTNFLPLGTNPWPHPHYRVYRRFLVMEENTRAWRKLGILKHHPSFAAYSTHRMILRLHTSGSLRRPVPEISHQITGECFKTLKKVLCTLHGAYAHTTLMVFMRVKAKTQCNVRKSSLLPFSRQSLDLQHLLKWRPPVTTKGW